MFERFTHQAREAVVLAQMEARDSGADRIRSEHLLLAMFRAPDNLAATILEKHRIGRAEVEADLARLAGGSPAPSDAEALATLGIDLDEVRRQVEEAFGPGALERTRAALGREGRAPSGHIPFDRGAKKVLELGLREAVLLGHRHIGCEHILLGMLHPPVGAAVEVLAARGVRSDPTRILVAELTRGRAAG